MLDTFMKDISSVATSQRHFSEWQLPKYDLTAALPPPQPGLAAEIGPNPVAPQRVKPKLWEVAT